MRPTRLISRIDIKGDDVIKSINLEGLKKWESQTNYQKNTMKMV